MKGMETEPLRCHRVLLRGRVQGVFFRQSTADQARRLGLRGWVRNLPDGRVEALIAGAPKAIEDLLDWMRAGGPPEGRVEDLSLEDAALPEPATFEIRDTPR